jgi:hypothetical protein
VALLSIRAQTPTPTETASPTPSATETVSPTPTATPVTHLDVGDSWWLVVAVLAVVLLAGLVIIGGRRWLEGPPPSKPGDPVPREGSDRTLIRSWLAISLVGGLLLFVAVSFWLDDTTLRSTLVGGLVANAGAAVAFYFAAKSSDQARQDILNASLGTMLVPNLIGMDLAKAQGAIAKTSLLLDARPEKRAEGAQVVDQEPKANALARHGSPVVAHFAGPIPDLKGSKRADAETALKDVGLGLVAEPEDAAGDASVSDWTPKQADGVPVDRKVTVKFTTKAESEETTEPEDTTGGRRSGRGGRSDRGK